MAIAKDKKVYTKTEQQVMNRFEEAFNKILNQSYDYETGTNYVADYLRELDSKSSTTFNHSVRVAANVFRELSKDKSFSRQEVLDYTRAALLHDVGKLTTNDNVLHIDHSLAPLKFQMDKSTGEKRYSNDFPKFIHMMQHSLDGISKAKELGFSKEDVFVSIGHHVASSCIESGPEGGFKNATYSRDSWEIKNGSNFVEGLLKENCSWIKDKDKRALEVITFYDIIEALRSNDRAYMVQKEWGSPLDENLGRDFYKSGRGSTVADIIKINMTPKNINIAKELQLVDKQTETRIYNITLQDMPSSFEKFLEPNEWKKLKKDFEITKRIPAIDMVRDKITNYYRNLPKELQNERKVTLSNTRIKEVVEDPKSGRAFFEEITLKDGRTMFVLDDKRLKRPIIFPPKAPEPNFEKTIENGNEDINSVVLLVERENSGERDTFANFDNNTSKNYELNINLEDI